MSPIFERIKRELYHPIPAFIFFFTTFYLLNMTWGLMLREEGISEFSFLTVLLGAVIVAKVFIIIDNLRVTNAFVNKPLIYATIWKSFLYGTATLIIRSLDFLVPFIRSTKSFTMGYDLFIAEVNWPRFWALQIWFYVLFFVFVAAREIVMAIGPAKVRRMFIGR